MWIEVVAVARLQACCSVWSVCVRVRELASGLPGVNWVPDVGACRDLRELGYVTGWRVGFVATEKHIHTHTHASTRTR